MAIKKAFEPLVEFLQANENKSIKTVMDDIVALASTKGRAAAGEAVSTFIKDSAGETVAILDYYFKRWMPLVGDEAVEFGKKASAASGFASMSKAGVSNWTKQQRTAKAATADILTQVEAGNLDMSEIADVRADIEEARKMIVATDEGFETREQVLAYLEDEGVEVA